jgi:carotenoid 1,2-hydratase
VGSVFSPYYARARKRGDAAADNYCAINVALYGTKRRWAMTERSSRRVSRDANSFVVGPSSMRWVDDELIISIDEVCMPLPWGLKGTVCLKPQSFSNAPITLDAMGAHFWHAVAPQARIDVELKSPKLSWSGAAYHDMNWGIEPLERGFKCWTWARATTARGIEVLYDVVRRDGSAYRFGCSFQNGEVSPRTVPLAHRLARGFWGMERTSPSEYTPRLIQTLEDAPFYTRNLVELMLDGETCEAVHESLSLDRFVNPVVQMMLPFRMPRIG